MSSAYNSTGVISKQESGPSRNSVRASKPGDITSLDRIYADDYLWVRPKRHYTKTWSSGWTRDLLLKIELLSDPKALYVVRGAVKWRRGGIRNLSSC
jgi:hypothetical protein